MAKKQTKSSYRRKQIKRHPVLKWLFTLLLILGLSGAGYVTYNINQAPQITKTELQASPGPENERLYVAYNDIPANYRNALIYTEDATFEHNSGVNIKGLFNLVWTGILSRFTDEPARGGSSITQQLVKLTAFSTSVKDQTPQRKIQEIYLALQLTQKYSKPEIFEYYVNKIYEGHERYGAQTISYFYFNKPLADLTLSQTAIIAGLGQSPTNFDLYRNPELVQRRRDIVLAAMFKNNQISQTAYQEALGTPVTAGLIPR